MNQSQIIDMAQSRAGITSDNKLSAVLGCNRSSISHWRSERRHIDDKFARHLADLAGIDRRVVMAEIKAQTATDPESKAVWMELVQLAKKAQKGAALAAICAALITPVLYTSEAHADEIPTSSNVYYVK